VRGLPPRRETLTRLNLAEFVIGRRFAPTRWLDFATLSHKGRVEETAVPAAGNCRVLDRHWPPFATPERPHGLESVKKTHQVAGVGTGPGARPVSF